MGVYFKINLEFNHKILLHKVEDSIKSRQKGYVCVVDGNVLATTHQDESYKKIINGSIVNACDGSSIAILASLIHHKRFTTFTGPELFTEFVSKNYKQFFLGNTQEILNILKTKFEKESFNMELFKFQPLPFKSVEEFDYVTIAKDINEFLPDIVWVSLGAPKQERFISKLIPEIKQGVLFAIGAAFNLYINNDSNKRAPVLFRKMHLEWIYRICQEPKRVGKRAFNYLKIIPVIVKDELRNCKSKID